MERSIYTYCFSTCDKGNAGWGFYASTDALLPHIREQDALSALLNGTNYGIPELKRQWFTPNQDLAKEEESILRYHPEKFAYRTAEIGGETYAVLTYGKNLGRETQGQLRPGNSLVYSLVGSPEEVKTHPACYYGDPAFAAMRRSSFIEGQHTVPTPRLEPVTLQPYGVITEETVMQFLQADESRTEQLTALFYSLLNERSGLHRAVIVCDRKEHIPFWIAAVTMLLPVETAKQVCFTTYDYLGTESRMEIPTAYHLCGVYSPTANGLPEVKATAYDVDALANSTAAVLFDAECIIVPDVKTDAFTEVIEAFCAGNAEPLRQYRKAIETCTEYRDFGTEYTRFYPFTEKKPELFHYYSKEVKWAMLKETCPALTDPDADTEAFSRACELTCIALDDHFEYLNPEAVRQDILRLTDQLMQRPDANMDLLEKLMPLLKRLGVESPEALLKNRIAQRLPQILRSYELDGVTGDTIERLTWLLDPFTANDRALMRQLMAALSRKSLAGSEKREEILHALLDRHFGMEKPELKPAALAHLFELVEAENPQAADSFCEHIMMLFPKWEPTRQEESLRAIDGLADSRLKDSFFKYYGAWLNEKPRSTVELLRLQNTLSQQKISYAQNMLTLCTDRIAGESDLPAQIVGLREYIRLFQKNADIFDPKFCRKVAGRIFQEYRFDDLNLVAELALEVSAVCGVTSRQQQFLNKVGKAVSAVGYSKSAWKKAVHNAPAPETCIGDIDSMRKLLIESVEDYAENAAEEPAAAPGYAAQEDDKKKSGGLFGFFKRKG